MDIRKIKDSLDRSGVSYWEVRKESHSSNNLSLKDEEKEEVVSGSDEGLIVRVLYRNSWGSASTSRLDDSNLKKVCDRAVKLAKLSNSSKNGQDKVKLPKVSKNDYEKKYRMKQDFRQVDFTEKFSFLTELHDKLHQSFVDSTEISYNESLVQKKVFTSEGIEVVTEIPRLSVSLSSIGNEDSLQRSSQRVGDVGGYEIAERSFDKIEEVNKRLKNLLKGDQPPSGNLPLIMDPSLVGVFAHEAFGHATEGDLVTSGNSCLKGKLGDKIASDKVTIRDDPTRRGFGSIMFDDEGIEAKEKVLVENGKLNDFILDKESSAKLNLDPNGGARAESFQKNPQPRMSNTIVDSGDHSFEELLEEVSGKAIYAKHSRGGQVDTNKGTFQFNAQSAFLVEDGEIKKPLKGVSFNGLTLKTLKNVIALSQKADHVGSGFCGKGGQIVPVGHGGPHMLVSNVTVGGRQ